VRADPARRGESRPADARRAEDGFTVIEIMVASMLLLIVVAFSFGALVSLQRTSTIVDARGRSMDQAHLAIQQIETQVRSSDILYATTGENPGGVSNAGTNPDSTQVAVGFSLRIYTQTNGTFLCDQWRVLDTGSLQTRSWSPTWQTDGNVSGWRTVATSLVNGSATLDPSNTKPFTSDATYSGLLDISLLTNADPNRSSNDALIASVVGRDIQYGVTTNACSSIPTP